MSNLNFEELSKKIAYITINPSGNFLKSAQLGFKEEGLFPHHLIYVRPTDRLLKEWKKYRFSLFSKFLLPQVKRFWGNTESFSKEVVNIKIPNVHKVSSLNSDRTVELIQSLGIKYLINCGAGIFRRKLIDLPGLIILNAHAGKLPEYKNMNVVEWALCNSDKVIGTVHQIDSGIDTGAAWLEKELNLQGASNVIEAREMAFDQVIRLVAKAVINYERGEIKPVKYAADLGKKWYRMHSYFQRMVNFLLEEHKATT